MLRKKILPVGHNRPYCKALVSFFGHSTHICLCRAITSNSGVRIVLQDQSAWSCWSVGLGGL